MRGAWLVVLCCGCPPVLASDRWGRTDQTYAVSESGIVAHDAGRSQPDRYLLATGRYADFVMTWRMRMPRPVTGRPRAIVVFHVDDRDVGNRRSFFLAGHCGEVGKWHAFKLVVLDGAVALSLDERVISRTSGDYGKPPRAGKVGFLHYFNYDFEYVDVRILPLDDRLKGVTGAAADVLSTGVVRLRWTLAPVLAGLVEFTIARQSDDRFVPLGRTRRLEWIDRDTAANETHAYRIGALTAGGRQVGEPAEVRATVKAHQPALPPTHVMAARRIDGSVRVSWRLAPFGRARTVSVLKSDRPIRDVAAAHVVLDRAAVSTTSHLDEAEAPGRHYAVAVSARGDGRPAMRAAEAKPTVPIVDPAGRFPGKHPYLLFTADDMARVRRLAERDATAKQVLAGLLTQARAAARTAFVVYPKGDDRHAGASRRIQSVAQAYALSGDEALARWVRGALVAYADVYAKLPVVRGSRRLRPASSLYEAMWYVPIILAYDFVYESPCFRPTDRRHIERDLLRPAAALFKIDDVENDPRVGDLHFRCYNFQAWHLAAVGLTGLCLRDPDLVEWAVDSRYGLKHLVSHDVRDDGLFWERSLGYHHFVLTALHPLLEAAWHCNLDLYHMTVPDDITRDEDANYVVDGDNGPKGLKLMFDAAFYFMFPDMTFGVVSDSSRGPLRGSRLYRTAWRRYGDPKFAWLVSRAARSDRALWRGPKDLSGRLRLAWDAEHLYVWADVTDDVVRNNHTDPATRWMGDLVWLGLKFTDAQPAAYDFIYALVPGDLRAAKPCLVLFNRYGKPVNKPSAGRLALKPSGHGYTIEAAIPLREMAPAPGEKHAPLRAPGRIGFEACLYDGDRTSGLSVKEKMLGWSSVTDRYDTSQGGTLILTSAASDAKADGNVCVAPRVSAPLTIDGRDADWPESRDHEVIRIADGARVTTDQAGGSDLDALVHGSPPPVSRRFVIGTGRFANTGVARDGSTLFPASGFAVLRSAGAADWTDGEPPPNKDGTCVLLNVGPHGGGHGHPDKLSIVVYANGRHWIPDHGSAAYGSDLKRQWTSHTVSHSTLVVDQTSQWPSGKRDVTWPCDNPGQRATGKLTTFFVDDVLKVAAATCDTLYEGVRLNRIVALVDEFVVDAFEATGTASHDYDYVLHLDGKLATDAGKPLEEPLGQRCGYQHITDLRLMGRALPWTGRWRHDSHELAVHLLGASPAEVVTGRGPTTTVTKKMAMLLVRRQARAATFVSIIESRPDSSKVIRATFDKNSRTVTVEGARGRYRLAWDGTTADFRGAFVCVKHSDGAVTASLVATRDVSIGRTRLTGSKPLNATLRVTETRCELDVQEGTGKVTVRAPLPASARVFMMGGLKPVAVAFEKGKGAWMFDARPDTRYVIGP